MEAALSSWSVETQFCLTCVAGKGPIDHAISHIVGLVVLKVAQDQAREM